jgi:RNA polymerase sigma-70 factor (ECF subfamily)
MAFKRPTTYRLDDETFALLYEQTHRFVFRFICGLNGGVVEDAEDLTADTYFRAWKARRHFNGDAEIALRWLMRIARNLVIDAYRRRTVRGPAQSIEDPNIHLALADPGAGPEEAVAYQEQFQVLWGLLQRLTVEQRELILLRYMFNWPVKTLANYLDEPENTVSVRLRRLLEHLRQDWPSNWE